MAYQDKLGITHIIQGPETRLSIRWDSNTGPILRYPIMVFSPDGSASNRCFEIPLQRPEARILQDWLQAYLVDHQFHFGNWVNRQLDGPLSGTQIEADAKARQLMAKKSAE